MMLTVRKCQQPHKSKRSREFTDKHRVEILEDIHITFIIYFYLYGQRAKIYTN